LTPGEASFALAAALLRLAIFSFVFTNSQIVIACYEVIFFIKYVKDLHIFIIKIEIFVTNNKDRNICYKQHTLWRVP